MRRPGREGVITEVRLWEYAESAFWPVVLVLVASFSIYLQNVDIAGLFAVSRIRQAAPSLAENSPITSPKKHPGEELSSRGAAACPAGERESHQAAPLRLTVQVFT
jgi:hypothetical protein